MNTIDSYKKELQKEFPLVYEWTDAPDTIYELHEHQGKVAFYITDGDITMGFDVPQKIQHTAVVGAKGVSYIVGQEIEDDA